MKGTPSWKGRARRRQPCVFALALSAACTLAAVSSGAGESVGRFLRTDAEREAAAADVRARPLSPEGPWPANEWTGATVTARDFHLLAYTNAAGESLPFQLFVPRRRQSDEKVPLMLFLHGASPLMDRPEQDVLAAPFLYFVQAEVQRLHPCFFVVPLSIHLPRVKDPDRTWFSLPADGPTRPLRLADEIVTDLCATYSAIDRERLYATGVSSGASGVGCLIRHFRGKYAAAVVVGGRIPTEYMDMARPTAVYIFDWSRGPARPHPQHELCRQLTERGLPSVVKYYAHEKNRFWNEAYRDWEMIEWLFDQRLGRRVRAGGEWAPVYAPRSEPWLLTPPDFEQRAPTHEAVR
jgi:hypothetical protein